MISIIVCTDRKGAIGKDGKLLHRCKEDMRHFKTMTSKHIVIMGRKTWESLDVKPLPDRFNIVVTRKGNIEEADITADNLSKVLEYYKSKPYEVFVIGGGEIYQQALPYADKIYLSVLNKTSEDADTFFPTLQYEEWGRASVTICPEVMIYELSRIKKQ